jgi:pimeloyl-ACP methyl ester carboxylesterase
MRTRQARLTILSLLFACLVSLRLDSQPLGATGHWEGTVTLTGQNLNLLLDIDRADAELHGTISILESRLEAFPLPRVRLIGDEFEFEVPEGWGLAMFAGLGLRPDEEIITFRGSLTTSAIEGQLRVGKVTFPLVLRRGRPPLPYREEEVSFSNGDVTLAGTLLLPSTSGRHPAVVFTHGSGSHTREAHRYEADLLVRRGVACLLYDKRGAGRSTGASWQWASFDDLAADAGQAVTYLTTRAEIESRHVGLFGLSQGAWLIEKVAARSPNAAFLVMVTGGGVPVWQQELYYRANQIRDQGFGEDAVNEAVSFMRLKFEAAKTGLGWDRVEEAIKGFTDDGAPWFPRFAGNQNTMAAARLWWLLAFSYDPAQDLKQIRIPVLGILAGDDRVMPTAETIEGLRSGLLAGGNRHLTTRMIPGASHSMTVRQDLNGAPLRRVISPDYSTALIQWVTDVVRKP